MEMNDDDHNNPTVLKQKKLSAELAQCLSPQKYEKRQNLHEE